MNLDASTCLWYRQPASQWIEALPIGNGYLGAMVFGDPRYERLQLNADSLWSGKSSSSWNNPSAQHVLPEVRALIAAGRYAEADRLCAQMQGPYTQSYLPLADVNITFDSRTKPTDYQRTLDLRRATVSVTFDLDGGVHVRRDVFASYPDRVIIMRLLNTRSESFVVHLSSALQYTAELVNPFFTARLHGQAPVHVDPNYLGDTQQPVRYSEDGEKPGMCFELQLRVISDGIVKASLDSSSIGVTNSHETILIITAGTSFASYDQSPFEQSQRLTAEVAQTLASAASHSYSDLLQRHLDDYQVLFQRVELELGGSAANDFPTDERLARYQQMRQNLPDSPDVALEALLFNYGRYLLIASSRPGTQPANLQGIWNADLRPPWSSNWTININTEMNYWLAEVTNLAECHQPLFDLIARLSKNGRLTAAENYGANGWVAHHNTDIWGQTAPVNGNPVYANWPMGGVWLCLHLWEHYSFGQDRTFLETTAWALMEGAAEFCLDWLIEVDGNSLTSPSTSPENMFLDQRGRPAAVSAATTSDIALIRELFTACIRAVEILQLDATFAARLYTALDHLLPYKIGRQGQLQEWAEDFEEAESQHRHTSHLIGLYPGAHLTPDATPELAAAAKRTLDLRGENSTGWSLAWKINLWARLYEPERAYQMIQQMLTLTTHLGTEIAGGGVYPNLFCAHPPFQIDGNFGYSAGIAELLLQSHRDCHHFLPALPAVWANGKVTGLRARGGFVVALQWNEGVLREATVLSTVGGPCSVWTPIPLLVVCQGVQGATSSNERGILTFDTSPGATYIIRPHRPQSQ